MCPKQVSTEDYRGPDRRAKDENIMNQMRAFVGLIVFMLGQTGAAIWWAAITTQNVKTIKASQPIIVEEIHKRLEKTNESLIKKIQESTEDRYKGSDAKRDFELRDRILSNIEENMDSAFNNFGDVLTEMRHTMNGHMADGHPKTVERTQGELARKITEHVAAEGHPWAQREISRNAQQISDIKYSIYGMGQQSRRDPIPTTLFKPADFYQKNPAIGEHFSSLRKGFESG